MKRSGMIGRLCAFAALLLLTACGGGGGGGGGGGTSTPPPPLTNFTTLTVDQGPSILNTGPNAYIDDNSAFVSVTICAPGSTSNCQTVDHVLVDTGSIGLRIFSSVLNPSLLGALTTQSDPSANPVGECYAFVDGYIFGSVKQADFSIGGESVANMPLQVIADSGVFNSPPASCSSGGGTNLNTVQAFGANGVIGIGVTQTDCGANCTFSGGFGAATYYDCPSSGCSTIIVRASSTTAPFQQLPNPVAAMAVDNNGTVMSLNSAPSSGALTGTGTLFFGIGTQTNNGLNGATVYTTTNSNSSSGPGLISATYKGQNLPDSFLDSGSNAFYFVDTTITACTQTGFTGFYCPASPMNLTPTIKGQNNVSGSAAFTLNNAVTVFGSANTAAPGIGANPNAISSFTPFPTSFDFGLTFFYGRPVYTAIEGRNAGGTTGPYFAF